MFILDSYNYGYDTGPMGQFHHEILGPDGITYGCYGYVNPFGNLAATFYISDGWGYRVVRPKEDVEIFLHEHEHHSDNSQSHDHEHHEHHGVVTPWKDLYFPEVCSHFEEQAMHPVSSNPSGPARK